MISVVNDVRLLFLKTFHAQCYALIYRQLNEFLISEPNAGGVWCDQSPLVGSGVEVINGGHGIKNPLLQNNVLTQLVNAQQFGKYNTS